MTSCSQGRLVTVALDFEELLTTVIFVVEAVAAFVVLKKVLLRGDVLGVRIWVDHFDEVFVVEHG